MTSDGGATTCVRFDGVAAHNETGMQNIMSRTLKRYVVKLQSNIDTDFNSKEGLIGISFSYLYKYPGSVYNCRDIFGCSN